MHKVKTAANICIKQLMFSFSQISKKSLHLIKILFFVLLLKTFTNSLYYKMYYGLILQKSVLVQRRNFYIVILQLLICLFKEKYTIIQIYFSWGVQEDKIVSFPDSTACVRTHTSAHVLTCVSLPEGGNVLADIHVISTHFFLDFNNNDVRVSL